MTIEIVLHDCVAHDEEIAALRAALADTVSWMGHCGKHTLYCRAFMGSPETQCTCRLNDYVKAGRAALAMEENDG